MLTPIQLQRNLTKGISQVNRLVKESLVKDDLAELNRQNLLLGKDGKGARMPLYSETWEGGRYGFMKIRMNPKNEGRWDLKLSGKLHSGITVSVTSNAVRFFQKSNAKYILEFGSTYLGLPQKQLEQIQLENIPELRQKLLNIILNV